MFFQSQAPTARKWLTRNNFLSLYPIIFIVLYGIGWIDYDESLTLAVDPFTTLPQPDRQFLHSSPLPFFIAHLFYQGVQAKWAFWLTAAVGFGFLISAFLAFLRSYEGQAREIALIGVISSPLLLVLLSWIGKADTYLIGGFLVLYLSQGRPVVRALALLVMVLAHREMGTIIFGLHCLLQRRVTLTDLAALASAHLVMFSYHHLLLSTAPASRADFVVNQLSIVLENLKNPVAHVLLTFGWFWAFVVSFLVKKQTIEIVLCIVICFGLAFVTEDFTRVFVLCSVPVMLHVIHPFAVRQMDLGSLIAYLPYLSLLQAQILAFNLVRDSRLPSLVWAILN